MGPTGSDKGLFPEDSTHAHNLLGYPRWRLRQRVHTVIARELIMIYAQVKVLVVNRVNVFAIYWSVA